ncbi:GtrA family protein [Herbaspirillum sp. RTI4]|uniref:GtrA family protein n=1 Tax=Herbaspirillum sp. RTI4 TaxID=3048640 RepID=UPI002AB4F577|nr:GtrA family protein [Herbaspirillum sp. RTI4]MDY7577792.1 GtrA family protein [Herbaspirillum sp. RTI4]MEA9980780.1 GtrA family protein [Herbaspirillum sp. RTI4]
MRAPEVLRLLRFGIIGAGAAAIHYATVVALVETLAVAPLVANVAGFALAFWCSFFGHRHWTFGDHQVVSEGASARRFLMTALFGFALNEGLFYLLLHVAALRYEWALAIAVVVVAGVTYVLSRLWAFRRVAVVTHSVSSDLPGDDA